MQSTQLELLTRLSSMLGGVEDDEETLPRALGLLSELGFRAPAAYVVAERAYRSRRWLAQGRRAEGHEELVEAVLFSGQPIREGRWRAVPVKTQDEIVGVLLAIASEIESGQTLLDVAARLLAPNFAARARVPDPWSYPRLVGRSKRIREVAEAIRTLGPTEEHLLLLGESGSGKERVVELAHASSDRKDAPLVRFNCAALPESRQCFELFGPGGDAPGGYASARGGTLYLDEVEELGREAQLALLEALSDPDSGGSVRLFLASTRDLSELVREGSFLPELLDALDPSSICVPALRERRSDIPLLADGVVERLARALDKPVRRISSRAIDLLMAYDWPGNVRELEAALERAVRAAEGEVIHGRHLPPTLQMDAEPDAEPSSLDARLATIERDLLDDALKSSRGNMAEAARQLGLTERRIRLRLARLGLDPKRHKRPR